MKILLVDDDDLLLCSLSAQLRRDCFEVRAVTNGKDALSEIRQISYDICFLDVKLPDANGLDLMKIFRKKSPTAEIIIMTATDLNDDQLNNVRAQACHYLPKPFDLDAARSLVRTIAKR